jgi:TfuA protein
MNRAIFIGPSLSHVEAKKLLTRETLIFPPIKRGDLDNLPTGCSVVGIVDGVFHGELAISPREILLALRRGVVILGSSSMGALRAAELDQFGMIGIGEVYRMYSEQEVTSDGEVAMLFDPETYVNITQPLVNIRYGIRVALENHVLSHSDAQLLLSRAIKIHYTELDYENLISQSVGVVLEQKQKQFLQFVYNNIDKIDLKKKDAMQLVSRINNILQ